MVQLVILAFLGQQFIVGAAFYDAAVFQHDNCIGVAHGGKPVCDDKHRAALHQAVHAFFNQRLGAGIDAGCGFIQNQHWRVGYGGAGNGQQLALALAQVGTVGGDHRVVSLG